MKMDNRFWIRSNGTYNILLLAMCANVFVQVIASHEFLTAFGALKPFLAGVRSTMPLQFIGPCEPLTAKYPGTNEWPFTYEKKKPPISYSIFDLHSDSVCS